MTKEALHDDTPVESSPALALCITPLQDELIAAISRMEAAAIESELYELSKSDNQNSPHSEVTTPNLD